MLSRLMALSPATIAVIVIVLLLLIYMLVVSLVAFCRFRIDKRRAEKGEWRISEKELFIYGAIGGAVGGSVAMWTYRHKTSKNSFCVPYIFLFVFNLAILITLMATIIIVPAIFQ